MNSEWEHEMRKTQFTLTTEVWTEALGFLETERETIWLTDAEIEIAVQVTAFIARSTARRSLVARKFGQGAEFRLMVWTRSGRLLAATAPTTAELAA
jgi:hypothetical protein